MKLIGCNAVAEIYSQLGGISALGRCAFCYMWMLCGVVVFHTSMINWRGAAHLMGTGHLKMSECQDDLM